MLENGINGYIPTKVHTPKGIKEVREIFPGDTIYDSSGRCVKVRQIDISGIRKFNQIEYTDGRILLVAEDEFTESFIIPKAISFETEVVSKLYPDPYTAGALLIYGDREDENINLPVTNITADAVIGHKYNLDFSYTTNGKYYFHPVNTPDNIAISWKEFFPNIDLSKIIPNYYFYTSILDRRKFIRGVFDTGYSKNEYPDRIGISHNSIAVLMEVQKMLWSLGVCSKIKYNPYSTGVYKEKYSLKVLGNLKDYPGFFYDVNDIEYMINTDNLIIDHDPKFNLEICSIDANVTRGWKYDIILEEGHYDYLSENFLPMSTRKI